MTKLTNLEIEVLKAIDKSEYGDSLREGVWTFTIADHIVQLRGSGAFETSGYLGTVQIAKGVKRTSIPGIVSSLCKKGLLYSCGSGKEQEVGITKDGQDAYVAAVGAANVRKFLQ